MSLLQEAFSVTRLSFWAGTMLSALIGSSLYINTHGSIESDARQRFLNHAAYAQSVISVRVKSYTDLLRAAGSMVQSSQTVTQQQFHEFARGLHLDLNYPAIDYINLALFFHEHERTAFVTKLRAEKKFLGPLADTLDIWPSGVRQDYLAVGYIEPEQKQAELYGYDLLSNHFFGNLLQRERDEGTFQAAGTPIPALSGPNNTYLGMRMPIYRLGVPLDSVAQRRA
ncbi:MAG: hypothetical protein EOO79_00680, partial [Oxalobacteraceae bacterium]